MDNNVKMEGIFKRIRNNQETLKIREKIFCSACITGDDNLVRLLLQIFDEVPRNSIVFAVESGNIISVELLLKARVDLQQYGHKALIKAVKKGYAEIAGLLIEAGVDANGKTGKGEPLRIAVLNNDIKLVELLLEKGADVQICNNYPLRIAVSTNNIGMTKLLLEKGANIHVNADFPLRYAIENEYEETVKVLLEYGADVHGKIIPQLRKAAIKGCIEIVKLLLEYGARFDNYLREYSFLLELNGEIAKLLLEGGAFNNTVVPFEEYERLRKKQKVMPIYILDFEKYRKIDIEIEKARRLNNATWYAMVDIDRQKNIEIINQILPTINEIPENFILHATEREDIELLEIFINNGGDIHVKNDYLRKFALEHHNIDIIEILFGNGGNPNTLDVFTRAVYEGDIEKAKKLLPKLYRIDISWS